MGTFGFQSQMKHITRLGATWSIFYSMVIVITASITAFTTCFIYLFFFFNQTLSPLWLEIQVFWGIEYFFKCDTWVPNFVGMEMVDC